MRTRINDFMFAPASVQYFQPMLCAAVIYATFSSIDELITQHNDRYSALATTAAYGAWKAYKEDETAESVKAFADSIPLTSKGLLIIS